MCAVVGLACGTAHPSSAEPIAVDVSGSNQVIASTAPPVGGSARPTARPGPVAAVAWRKDAEAAAQEADRSGKPLLVYLRAEWCVSCLELERAWRGDASFERASRSFVPLWLDATDDAALAEVTARFGRLPVPSMALIDRKTGRRSLLDTRASLDRAADSVLAFISEDSQ